MDSNSEYHLLNIEDETGKRTIPLDAATYSVGRDASNAIVIQGHGVSRQHALLLRLPSPSGYRYRIVDGNADGKRSANGILVNGKRVQSHNLNPGDEISFGGHVKAHYTTVSMAEAEFTKYLNSINYHSIKAVPLTTTATIVDEEQEHEGVEETNFNAVPPPMVEKTVRFTPSPPPQSPLLWIVVIAVTVALVLGIGVAVWQQQPPPEQAPPTQPKS
ncbi:hypothetical protein BRW62_04865 [Parathermosynechococcus lividus PCC 6715]|uniref:FHA domain-containing protein n=1 Tax=Parathermosynechococcus lividus PCC 6715 TaxID=1917166 RepID=A0A2D2Q0Z9_PARLV|nr:FHA domain-containing protein [Thermostichus lividus]ATS18195.1 hypothetical protein BRW62_04865 [Thermostichus lividus PCC 6715]